MPTCGECALLVQNKAGAYICVGKLSQCLGGETPQTEASHCLKFEKKQPQKASK